MTGSALTSYPADSPDELAQAILSCWILYLVARLLVPPLVLGARHLLRSGRLGQVDPQVELRLALTSGEVYSSKAGLQLTVNSFENSLVLNFKLGGSGR